MTAETRDDDLLTPAEVAKLLSMHEGSLAAWRSQKRGPKWVKLGDKPKSPVRYRRGDLAKYLADNQA